MRRPCKILVGKDQENYVPLLFPTDLFILYVSTCYSYEFNSLSEIALKQLEAYSGRLISEDVRQIPHCFCVLTLLWRSQWPRGLRRGFAASSLLGLWFRIPPGTWISVSFECCLLSGRGFCVGLATGPEEPYRVWCVWMWSWILKN